jgi:prophage regulatory protein
MPHSNGVRKPRMVRGECSGAIMEKKLIRLPQVRLMVGLSRSQIYLLISRGDFPRPVPLGARAVAWDNDEIQVWVRKCIEARKAA